MVRMIDIRGIDVIKDNKRVGYIHYDGVYNLENSEKFYFDNENTIRTDRKGSLGNIESDGDVWIRNSGRIRKSVIEREVRGSISYETKILCYLAFETR